MKLIRLFLYGGLDKDDYKRIEGDIWKENRKNQIVFCSIQILILSFMCFLSKATDNLTNEHFIIYSAAAISMTVLLLLFIFLPPKKLYVGICLDFCYIITYATAIYNCFILESGRSAVSFMVYLVFLPYIVGGRPISMILRNFVVIISFLVCNHIFCSDRTLLTNFVNALIFGALITIFASFTMRGNIQRYLAEYKLRYLGDIDILTGVNNRNYYEQNVNHYKDICKEELNCIYIDLNGLHEMNNTKGHEIGDFAIRKLAEKLKQNFRQNDIYRIGGDEFVIFVTDTDSSKVTARMDECCTELANDEIYISYGIKNMKKSDLDMTSLIKDAEMLMFNDKEAFYKDRGLTHR